MEGAEGGVAVYSDVNSISVDLGDQSHFLKSCDTVYVRPSLVQFDFTPGLREAKEFRQACCAA